MVLLWHHDEDGAVGLVVNRLLEHALPDVLALDNDEDIDLSPYAETMVAWGGPVEGATATVITRGQVKASEGWVLDGGISITRSQDALIRLIRERAELLLTLGYAGWGPGQLDQEIQAGGWLLTDPVPRIIFDEPVDDRYDLALATLGLTQQMVWMQPIDE